MMTLCLYGPQSLDEMEKWVHQCFDSVPNNQRNDPTLEWWGKEFPYAEQTTATGLEVVPIKPSRTLSISWLVNSVS
jgi:secreted Zn-dependent insulinase-like peptidase